ncbi:hypothetical protein GY45DRAFT_1364971, partial [Cubamyces sp. BRFM 1775]
DATLTSFGRLRSWASPSPTPATSTHPRGRTCASGGISASHGRSRRVSSPSGTSPWARRTPRLPCTPSKGRGTAWPRVPRTRTPRPFWKRSPPWRESGCGRRCRIPPGRLDAPGFDACTQLLVS